MGFGIRVRVRTWVRLRKCNWTIILGDGVCIFVADGRYRIWRKVNVKVSRSSYTCSTRRGWWTSSTENTTGPLTTSCRRPSTSLIPNYIHLLSHSGNHSHAELNIHHPDLRTRSTNRKAYRQALKSTLISCAINSPTCKVLQAKTFRRSKFKKVVGTFIGIFIVKIYLTYLIPMHLIQLRTQYFFGENVVKLIGPGIFICSFPVTLEW